MNSQPPNPCVCIWSAYTFKKILDVARSNKFNYITEDKIFEAFKRVHHTAPLCVYREALNEMIEWQILKKISRDWYIIPDNAQTRKIKKRLNKLNPSAFPF